jgi:transposase InsO family protein
MAKGLQRLDLKPIRTRPYTPRTNGKAERFIKTLLGEWAYAMPFQTSSEERYR